MDQPVVFGCAGEECVGILSWPDAAATALDCALLIVVGGPQYRVGSHRQFVTLARYLAKRGVCVLRFDYRGMGDSDGPQRTFIDVEEDIRAAMDVLCERTGKKRVLIWGLCDGATAALMYARGDGRVVGLACVNPWAHNERDEAAVRLKHYYVRRLLSAEFWRKLFSGRVAGLRTLKEILGAAGTLAQRGDTAAATGQDAPQARDFLTRMERGWSAFRGKVLIMLSGRDYTAREFESWAASRPALRTFEQDARVSVERHATADHTFSSRETETWMCETTFRWVLRSAQR